MASHSIYFRIQKGGFDAMKWLNKFWKRNKQKIVEKNNSANLHFDSIENLPIWNWNKIQETGDYTYLRIDRINGQVTKSEYKILNSLWEKIFDEYIARFGFSSEFISLMEKKKHIALLQLQFIQSGDRSLITFIELEQKELEQLQAENGGEKNSFYKSKTHLEKFLGFQIDVKKTSVVEFHSYIEMIKQERKSA